MLRANGSFIGQMNRPTRGGANGLYGMRDIQENQLNTTWPQTPGDPFFANVTVLVHGDDQESFINGAQLSSQHWRNCGSGNNLAGTIGGSGAPRLSTSAAKFGNTSIAITGSGIGSAGADAGCTFGTNDFTIEMWLYVTALGATNFVDCRPTTGTNGNYPNFGGNSGTGDIAYFVNSANKIVSGAGVITTNTWIHYAVSRVSGNTRLYVAGNQVGSTFVDATNYISNSVNFGSGLTAGGATGFMQEMRVTKGVGRYSGTTLTVPTAKFPDSA